MQRHQDEAEPASGQEGKASGETGRSEGRPARAETCSDVRPEEIWLDSGTRSAVASGTQSEAAQEVPSETPPEPREPRSERREPRPERVRNREQGRVEALRAAVLAFARARLAPLAAEDAAAIASLSDENELRELVDTLSLAESVSDARAVLDAAIDGRR